MCIRDSANVEWTSKFIPNKTICADVKKDDVLITFYDKDLGTEMCIRDSLRDLSKCHQMDFQNLSIYLHTEFFQEIGAI